MDTAEAISKRLGKKTIESNSISQSVSLMNYNGNKSTSLIARDLLTPDEVKNLHYKTIIFPNIGYPIFRDTVIYKKLSCYSSGELERKTSPLKDLSYTYFTAENIKLSGKRFSERVDNEIDIEARDFYKEQRKNEEEALLKAVEQIENIVKEEELNYDYKEKNNRTYASITVNRSLTTIEKSQVQAQIDSNYYHIEIDEGDNNKNIIEVHLKNAFELDKSIEKGTRK